MGQWFHMWHLFCPYFFLISPSLGALGRPCFVIVAFPGYLHLGFCTKSSGKANAVMSSSPTVLYCNLSLKPSDHCVITITSTLY